MKFLAHYFELSRGGDSANVRPMEGLRGFAVFLVFMVHYVSLVTPWIPNESYTMAIANALHSIGNSGVDLFFVLSGFLIYGSLINRKQRFVKFIYRRIERIYPTFTVVFLLYICLSFLFPIENKIPVNSAEAFIYLVQNFLLLPGLLPIQPMITVAWSLSYEMFYYLAIPLVIELARLRDRSQLWRIGFFILFALFSFCYCAVYGGPVRLIMFISGILLFEAMSIGETTKKPSSSVGVVALTLGLLGILLPIVGVTGSAIKTSILFITFFLLCLTCFRNPSGRLARSFCFSPLRWLGNMSYSYYLLHGLSLKASFFILHNLLPSAAFGSWFFWILLPFMFSISLVPTAALFLAVEYPCSLSPSHSSPKTSTPCQGMPDSACVDSQKRR